MPPTPEAQARAQIDDQLVATGWVVQDVKAVNFSATLGIAHREVPLKTCPHDHLAKRVRTRAGQTGEKANTLFFDRKPAVGKQVTSPQIKTQTHENQIFQKPHQKEQQQLNCQQDLPHG